MVASPREMRSPGKLRKFDINFDSVPRLHRKMAHPRVRFECENFAYLVGIVISEVDTGTNTKLKYIALRWGDDAPANLSSAFGFPRALTI